MKQLKFLMVALTLLMGVSFTSCISGDDNPIKQLDAIVKFEGGIYGSGTFKMIDGTELESVDPTHTLTLTSGKIYYIYFSYNVNEVVANKPIKVTLLASPSDINGPSVIPSEGAPTIDAPMYSVNFNDQIYPFMFDKNVLILPAMFWIKDATSQDDLVKEMKKHQFVISYDEIKEGDSTLSIHINHVITEDKDIARSRYTYNNYAYNLQNVISEFTGRGNVLKKIVVKAKVNGQSNSLKDTKDQEFEIDYTKITSEK